MCTPAPRPDCDSTTTSGDLDAVKYRETAAHRIQLVLGVEIPGEIASRRDERPVSSEVGEAKSSRPPLAGSGELSRAAQLEIGFGYLEAVVTGAEHLEPSSRVLSDVRLGHQDAPAFAMPTPDSSAELVKL
jgi:hypothetical protein